MKILLALKNGYLMVRWHIDLRTVNPSDFGEPPIGALVRSGR